MKLRNGWFFCDICHTKVYESQMIQMAEDDPYPHVCHNCIIEGWISYCIRCFHTFNPSDIGLEFMCDSCTTTT